MKNEVVKKKIFDMTPITIDDAIAALDLMDHPFYVFRNAVSSSPLSLQGGVNLLRL